MDLPTCPACGQSVLDDDVEDCPFCGASMTTGQPSSKPPAQKAAPAKPQAGREARPKPSDEAGRRKPGPAEGSGRSAAPATTDAKGEADEEDPFAVDSSAMRTAIRARAKPAKGRLHKVVCPMCETVGFVPRKAVGKEVRCANRECLVPLFTAPEIEKKPVEPAEPEKKPGLPMGVVAALSIVLLAAVGGGIWFFVLRDDGAKPPGNGIGANGKEQNGNGTHPKPPKKKEEIAGTENKKPENGKVPLAKDVPKLPGPAEMRRIALEQMIAASRQRDRNRSKPYCRRLTAEAYAEVGDLKEARAQLEHLRNVGRGLDFYQIAPLVAIAWKESEAGRKDAAGAAVDEARTVAAKLPEIGRDRLDMATMLATVLVAFGRAEDAESLVGGGRDNGPEHQTSAALQIAWAMRTYDFDAASSGPLLPWTAPQRVAVTLSLFAHGFRDEAVRWAERSPGIEEQTDCLVALATAVAKLAVEDKQPQQLLWLREAAKALPPAGQARVLAGAAGGQLAAGDESGAEQTLEAARAALKSVPVPDEFVLPGMKELCRLGLPPAAPLRTAALAAAEIARLEVRMGQPQAAWNSLAAALQFTRALAPAPPAIRQRREEIERVGLTAIGNQLKSLLELESYDAAVRAARNYRKNCDKIVKASRGRLGLQVSLLARAADWAIRDRIWDEISGRSAETVLDKKEPFFETSLPWTLADRYREAGDEDKAEQIETAVSGGERGPDPWETLQQTTARLVAAGDVAKAAEQVESFVADRRRISGWMLRLACRLVAAGNTESAFAFVAAIEDQVLRELALTLVAAQATGNGEAGKVWAFVEDERLSATERVSVYRGLIAGLSRSATRTSGSSRP